MTRSVEIPDSSAAPAGDGGLREALEKVKQAKRRLWAGLMAVKPELDEPYPDDARWTPWTRFVGPRLDDLWAAFDALLLAAHPAAPAGSGIQMVDIAAEAREMYGKHADEIAGRKLPEHEWRFELLFDGGARATMHHGATADDVQAYLAMMQNEGRTLQLTPAAPAVPQPVDREALQAALLRVWLGRIEDQVADSPEGHCASLVDAVLAVLAGEQGQS